MAHKGIEIVKTVKKVLVDYTVEMPLMSEESAGTEAFNYVLGYTIDKNLREIKVESIWHTDHVTQVVVHVEMEE